VHSLLRCCVPRRPLALSWHVSKSCLLLVSNAHTRKWVSKCSKQAMAHVDLRDISRSKMSVKWETSVGELVQVLAYDSSGFCRLSSLCSLLGQLLLKNLFCLARNWLCPKNILVHRNAQKLTYRHLGFQKFPGGDTPGPPLEGEGRRREEKGKDGRGRGCKGKKRGRGGAYLLTLFVLHVYCTTSFNTVC